MIDRPPEIMCLTPDLHKNLVQMPFPLRDLTHLLTPALLDLLGEERAEPVDPLSNAFMAKINATLMEQVFDVAKREWKPDIHHHSKADDLR